MSEAPDSSASESLPLGSAESGALKASIGVETGAPVASAGGLLRQARETAGLHIATLAVLLKVPVKKLEALESDRFDLLPDAVFVRALASSVCRHLKIDPVAVLQLLPQTANAKLVHQSRGINTPFRGSGDRVGPSLWVQVSRPAVLAGVVLLLGALVLVLLPTLKSRTDASSPNAVPQAMNTQTTMLSAIGMVADTVSAAISSPQPSASAESPSPSAAMTAVPLSGSPSTAFSSLPSSTSAPAEMQTPAVPVSPASTAPALASTGIVVFTAKGASWVQVSDAKGVVVLRRTLAPGEVVGASGALPLSAIVGRADATQVQIRGSAFDLSAVAKDNVARFEVK